MSQRAAFVSEEQILQYQRDGVVLVPKALDPEWVQLIEYGFRRAIRNPGPLGFQQWHDNLGPTREYLARPGDFWQDLCNCDAVPEFQRLIRRSPLAAIFAALMKSQNIWFYYEQIFAKQGPSRRTLWHQDATYLMIDGDQTASMWTPLGRALDKSEALEFAVGTHKGPVYDGFKYTAGSDGEKSQRFYGLDEYPPLPDIEANREQWSIVSFEMQPGDVVFFHGRTLHGGGYVKADNERRAFAMRVFGDNARYVERPHRTGHQQHPGVAIDWKTGDLPRDEAFPQIFPYANNARPLA